MKREREYEREFIILLLYGMTQNINTKEKTILTTRAGNRFILNYTISVITIVII